MTQVSRIFSSCDAAEFTRKERKNDRVITHKVYSSGPKVLCFTSTTLHCPKLTHMIPAHLHRVYSLHLCPIKEYGFGELVSLYHKFKFMQNYSVLFRITPLSLIPRLILNSSSQSPSVIFILI